MIPRDPGKRIRIRRCLFGVQFTFLATKILVSVLATGDFISLMIQSFAFLVFFSYVPWALVCDFRTAKEVRIEWERIRRIRRGEELEHVGESTLEVKGKKNRWRSDRAWQECLFLTLQGLCWLVSAIFAGIQGGPSACQRIVLQNAVVSGLDRLVPDTAASQFCDGMTANIALSCLGVVFTLLWLWWVCYSVKTLRKFEKTTQDGQEVMIVREKVWQKSMARLLRRDEDDDVNGIKRIVTGGLVDLIEMESRRGSIRHHTHGNGFGMGRGRSVPGNGFVRGATTPRPSHESERSSAFSSPVDTMAIGVDSNGDRRRHTTPEPAPGLERRNTNDIIQSLPRGSRSEMPPPPYIGQPSNEGTANTFSSSGSGTGTGTGSGTANSHESPMSNLHQAILARSNTVHSQNSANRPLPLAPPEVDRVVERKIDELSGTSNGGTMDAYTAMQLGIGPAGSAAREHGKGGQVQRVEDIVDQKMDSFNRAGGASGSSSDPATGRRETMEQLVDRKITWAGENDRPTSPSPGPVGNRTSTGPLRPLGPVIGSPSYEQALLERERTAALPQTPGADFVTSPTQMTTSEPRAGGHHDHDLPPRFQHRANTNAIYSTPSASSRKGKAAEAGYSITNPSPTTTTTSSGTGNGTGEMSLEEMIELKMAALRASSAGTGKGKDDERPQPSTTRSGEAVQKSKTRRRGKGKGRARAGSDPGPALERHLETDEESL